MNRILVSIGFAAGILAVSAAFAQDGGDMPQQQKIDQANKAMGYILRDVHQCVGYQGQDHGFTEKDFSVFLDEGGSADQGPVKKLFCMGNIAAGLNQAQQHEIGVVCSACLEKYDTCRYKNGAALSGEKRLDCLTHFQPYSD